MPHVNTKPLAKNGNFQKKLGREGNMNGLGKHLEK